MKCRHTFIALFLVAAAGGVGAVVWLSQEASRAQREPAPHTANAHVPPKVADTGATRADASPDGPAVRFVVPGASESAAVAAVVGAPGLYPTEKPSVAAGGVLTLPDPAATTLSGREASDYEVYARTLDDAHAYWGDVSIDGAGSDAIQQVELDAAVPLDVTVVDKAGKPVTGAEVRVSRGLVSLVHLMQSTKPSGAAHFAAVPPGDYRLTVQAAGFVRRSRHLLHTAQASKGAADQVRMQLDHGATVTGRVVDTNGNPIRAATVQVIPVSPFADETVDAEFLSQVGVASQTGTADKKGHFSLGGIAVGAVRVRAEAPGWTAGLSDIVRAGHGGVVSAGKIVLDPKTLRKDLLVRINSDLHTRFADVELLAERDDKPHTCRGRRIKASDWRFPNCGVGKRTLVATTASGTKVRWTGDFDESTEVQLNAPQALGLFVTDAAGSPVAGALVQLWRDDKLVFEGTSDGAQPIRVEVPVPFDGTLVGFDGRRGEGSTPVHLTGQGDQGRFVARLDKPLFSPGLPPGNVHDQAAVERILGAKVVRDTHAWLVDMVAADSPAGKAGIQRGDRLVYVRKVGGAYAVALERGDTRLEVELTRR